MNQEDYYYANALVSYICSDIQNNYAEVLSMIHMINDNSTISDPSSNSTPPTNSPPTTEMLNVKNQKKNQFEILKFLQ